MRKEEKTSKVRQQSATQKHITIFKLRRADDAKLMILARKLWPYVPARDLKTVFGNAHKRPAKATLIGARTDTALIGFIYATVRVDYVEGSDTSPVAYLEGIYVEPQHRKQGIAQEMLAELESWSRKKGLTELGSDAYATNKLSRRVHVRLGFKPQPLIAPFLKKIA